MWPGHDVKLQVSWLSIQQRLSLLKECNLLQSNCSCSELFSDVAVCTHCLLLSGVQCFKVCSLALSEGSHAVPTAGLHGAGRALFECQIWPLTWPSVIPGSTDTLSVSLSRSNLTLGHSWHSCCVYCWNMPGPSCRVTILFLQLHFRLPGAGLATGLSRVTCHCPQTVSMHLMRSFVGCWSCCLLRFVRNREQGCLRLESMPTATHHST